MTIVGGTWSYSGNPATDEKDAVRFLIGDVDTRRQLISDEEILWAITDANNRYGAAATCCRLLGSESAASGTVTVGDMSEGGGRDAAGWMDLAAVYDRKAVLVGSPPTPYFGGESMTRRDTVAGESDRRPPTFAPGQFTRSTGAAFWTQDST